MTDYTAVLIRSLREFAEEVAVTGLRSDALGRAVAQYNDLWRTAREPEPDNPIWSHVTPLDVETATASELSLMCTELLRVIEQRGKKNRPEQIWHVTRETALHGSFSGLVIVHSGVEFRLHGYIKGTIVLLGTARLKWLGSVNGRVEQSPQSTIAYHGDIGASIHTVDNLEEKYKALLETPDETAT